VTLALPTVLGGRFRLESVLGQGGMGVVYRGTDTTLGRAVAVKLIQKDADDEQGVLRFLNEAKNLALVKSAHVVTLYDVARMDDGSPYLVMELLEGETVSDILEHEGKMTAARAIALARQACEGLSDAHARGLVHRDVKPGNLHVSRRGDREHLTILDFGIVKNLVQGTKLTAEGSILGTAEYMAPEQITGEPVDARTDQYALAGTLFRMMTGAPVFSSENAANLIHLHLTAAPPSLVERVEGLSASPANAIARALSKKKAERFPDMKSFSAALAEGAKNAAEKTAEKASREVARDFTATGDIELDEAAKQHADGFELDRKPVPEPRAPAPNAPIGLRIVAPLAPPAPKAAGLERAAGGGPLAVLRSVPISVWKRVAAYSALVLVIGNACFGGSLTFSAAFGVCVAIGALGMLAHRGGNIDRDAP
jgi:serine/threonine protein kinase